MAPRSLTFAALVATTALSMGGCGGDADTSDSADTSSQSAPSTPDDPATSGSATPSVPAVTEEQVDIGGHEIYLRCWGEAVVGEPTVLLISGMGPDVTYWSKMASEFATDGHHLCGYDRLGVGGSSLPSEDRRTTEDQVDDLLALLDAAGLDEPMVIVAHSLGSLPALGLADRAPELVAGAVLIEPWGPRVAGKQLAVLPPEKADESQDLVMERSFLTGYIADPDQNNEHLLLTACNEEGIAVLDKPGRLFGNHPVVVLQAPLPRRPAGLPRDYDAVSRAAWVDANDEFATESTDGKVIVVKHTGHDIHIDRPDAVIEAILDVLAG
ncbi:alpha/beta hydrolase [Nocardioides humilatus]|uniref:Alpha/beta hydrolase n=1 Tax=Nocardioides humilatus TaxID=2607660 RepID=A0A5B1LAY7_9ACTN|nr:alpha/beta hydrolase [Nocardioides humilatus]KAA1417901.1 alpha/beta hydrolase [Nocardioides humilatus]